MPICNIDAIDHFFAQSVVFGIIKSSFFEIHLFIAILFFVVLCIMIKHNFFLIKNITLRPCPIPTTIFLPFLFMISHLQTISTSFPIVVVIGRFQIRCGGGRAEKIGARNTRPVCCVRRFWILPSVRILKRYIGQSAAIIERITPDACHTIWDGHAR